jgi:fused signal recognition particle receptor
MTAEKKPGLFGRLLSGLTKSSKTLTEGLSAVFTKKRIDAAMLEALEELLITADLGAPAAARITRDFGKTRMDKDVGEDEIKSALADAIANELAPFARTFSVVPSPHKPHVIVFVGVNGAGKTTTVGKLAAQLRAQGASVVLAACDTFRAAAVEQLQVWGERTGCPVISKPLGADAAGVAFEAIEYAQTHAIDVVLIDTAGRLQNKQGLMDELAKVLRAIKKRDDSAPHDVLLVLDATVGRNALSQVAGFDKAAGITGLVMTKLDGTARGGVLLPVAEAAGLPITLIGVGEGVEDLIAFNARKFADGLVGLSLSVH